MTYPLFLEQLLLARDQFALEPTVRVNFTNYWEPVESISTADRVINIHLSETVDWENKYEETAAELEEVKTELKTANDTIEELRERLREKNEELANWASQCEELEEELGDLKADSGFKNR